MADTTMKAEMTEEEVRAQATATIDFAECKKENSLNYVHNFLEEVEIEGKKYKKLTFYFENLTGEDIEAVEEEMQLQNKYAISPEISSTFKCILAARAAGIGSDEIRRLPVKDYMKITNKARDFLISAGSEK